MALQPITFDEFAALEAANGGRMIRRSGIYWKVVRPFFYQPLIPWAEYPHASLRGPTAAVLGGWQHVVPAHEPSNSSLRFLAFSGLRDYGLDSLDYNRRRQLKIAMRRFTVREMVDREELSRLGYPVYLDFYARTDYDYYTSRTQEPTYAAWSNRLFDCQKLLILGAFDGNQLVAISVSYLFGSSLSYMTFFSTTDAQKSFISDLMLHQVREFAAERQEVTTLIATRYKGGSSLDRFYLMRGAEIVVKPSYLTINPLASLALKLFFPKRAVAVWGEGTPQPASAMDLRKVES